MFIPLRLGSSLAFSIQSFKELIWAKFSMRVYPWHFGYTLI